MSSGQSHFRAIVADPPWPIRWDGGMGGRRRRTTRLDYALMSIDAIKALSVADLADPEACALFLWVTNELHREGVGAQVARAWGFRPAAELIWRKPNYGMGAFPRAGHEVCIVAARGPALNAAPRNVHSVQTWRQPVARGNGGKIHSAKPDGFYDLVQLAVPGGPWVELFARSARLGWEHWGDQTLQTVELAG